MMADGSLDRDATLGSLLFRTWSQTVILSRSFIALLKAQEVDRAYCSVFPQTMLEIAQTFSSGKASLASLRTRSSPILFRKATDLSQRICVIAEGAFRRRLKGGSKDHVVELRLTFAGSGAD